MDTSGPALTPDEEAAWAVAVGQLSDAPTREQRLAGLRETQALLTYRMRLTTQRLRDLRDQARARAEREHPSSQD